MRAPEYPCDISREWVEFVLNDYEKKQQPSGAVIVDNYTKCNGLAPGDGFAGQLVKLEVQATLTTEHGSENKLYNLMVKLMDASAMDREMNRRSSSDIREITMYQEVIPELNRFAKSHGVDEFCLSMPEILYGKCTDDQFVLVMENLKQHGFDTLPNEKGLDYTQMIMAVEYLAKLHALSYSYDKSYNFLEKFPCYKNDYMTKLFFSFAKFEGLMNAKTVLSTIDNSDDLLKKIESTEKKLLDDYDDATQHHTTNSIMCLTHSDLWNKNLMFKLTQKDDREETTQDIQVLDWQRSHWNTSVFDLHFLIYTSTTHQLRKQHLDDILHHYHLLFISIINKMDIALEWNFEDFKTEFNRLHVFGVLRGLSITQLIMSDVAKKMQEKKAVECYPYSFMRPVYYYLAKVLTMLKLTSPVQYLFLKFINYMFGFVGNEMVEGKNPHLRERVLGIVYDADAEGLFDQKLKYD